MLKVNTDFFAAELASSHDSAVEAFMAAGIDEKRATDAASFMCSDAPLASIEIVGGNSVCVAQLPDGQFGLFCGCSAAPTTDEAAIQRDVNELCARHGTLWIIVERNCLCWVSAPAPDVALRRAQGRTRAGADRPTQLFNN